jgi:hypothetical protein
MIDSPSNNVPSVRKDGFELDRNINRWTISDTTTLVIAHCRLL